MSSRENDIEAVNKKIISEEKQQHISDRALALTPSAQFRTTVPCIEGVNRRNSSKKHY